MNLLKSLLAFLFVFVSTLFTASDAQAFALGNHVGGFFLGTLDCAESETSGTRDLCRENGWLNYDTLSGCAVATNKIDNIRGYRYVSEGEIKAIQETGMLRGGNPGETFFTKDVFKTSKKAQQRLSLQSAPTHRIEFDIINNPTLQRNGTKVDPLFGQPGKGAEFMTTDPVRVNLINVQPLQ